MGVWGRTMRMILKEEKITLKLAAAYVDDVRLATSVLEKGRRWQKETKKFVFNLKWKEEDEEKAESDEVRTSNEIEKSMNSIFKNIQFEKEIPDQFEGKKLPTLDFEMWLETPDLGNTGEQLIMYSYYEKEVSSPFCIMEKSAMAENTKISSLSQDLVRRMLNTSEMVSQVHRNDIIEKYAKKLERSGYSKVQRRRIIEAGLKGYQAKVEKSEKTGIELHRAAKSTIAARYKKKLLDKTNWFRKERKGGDRNDGKKVLTGVCKPPGPRGQVMTKEKPPVTVIFVSRTPGGELVNRLRQAEAELSGLLGDRIKFVERAGTMLKNIFHKSNPQAGQDCGRLTCLVHSHGESGGGDCKRRNITYKTSCIKCLEEGKEATYYGESSRTAFERGLEHAGDFLSEKSDSHILKHQLTEHPELGKNLRFSMKVIRQHKSAFQRQVHEAVIIQMNENTNILNSKGEYNRCVLPRLGVIFGEKELKKKPEKEEKGKKSSENVEADIWRNRTKSKRGENRGTEDQPRSKRRKKNEEKNRIEKRQRTFTQEASKAKKSRIEIQHPPLARSKLQAESKKVKQLFSIFNQISEKPKLAKVEKEKEDSIEIRKTKLFPIFEQVSKSRGKQLKIVKKTASPAHPPISGERKEKI